jgi:hypothetical protein
LHRLAVPLLAFAAAAAVLPAPAAEPVFALEVEAGPVWQNRNDVQIPNDASGTRFSLDELVGDGPWVAGRVYVTWDINDRHGLRVLLAPLSYTESGVFDLPVSFAGATYAPGVPTEATYQFNSWRIGYRYRFHEGPRWRWWIGGTIKVRDAKIELQQGGVTSRDSDVGFVPLLHVSGRFTMSPRWDLLFELEALGGGPGRAEDGSIKLSFDLSERWSVAAGYRLVEGGADTDEVYNFAWFNYAVVSGTYRF